MAPRCGLLAEACAHVTPDPEAVLESSEVELSEVCLRTKGDPRRQSCAARGLLYQGLDWVLVPRASLHPQRRCVLGVVLCCWCVWQLAVSEVIRHPVCRKGETEAQGPLPGIECWPTVRL